MAELATQLRILELFSETNTLTLGPTEAGRRLDMNKASAGEHMTVLAAAGYLRRVDGGYAMGDRLFRLSHIFVINRLAEIAAQATESERQARSLLDLCSLSAARLAGGHKSVEATAPLASSQRDDDSLAAAPA